MVDVPALTAFAAGAQVAGAGRLAILAPALLACLPYAEKGPPGAGLYAALLLATRLVRVLGAVLVLTSYRFIR